MYSVKDLCKRRTIEKFDIQTPVVVPSFSSKGFEDLETIWSRTKDFLSDAALISAYDIYYQNLSTEVDVTNLLFIDSGGYEAQSGIDVYGAIPMPYISREWDREKHIVAIKQLSTYSSSILVSYDELTNSDNIEKQISFARDFFAKFPESSSDFLIKPQESTILNPDDVIDKLEDLKSFDILGFTEKELGDSTIQRLRTLIKIRMALNERGMEKPIHIFGCLEPIVMSLFFLCGADIFDGLSWLRLSNYNGLLVNINSWAYLENNMGLNDINLTVTSWINNLNNLSSFQLALKKFVDTNDVSELPIPRDNLENILNTISVDF